MDAGRGAGSYLGGSHQSLSRSDAAKEAAEQSRPSSYRRSAGCNLWRAHQSMGKKRV